MKFCFISVIFLSIFFADIARAEYRVLIDSPSFEASGEEEGGRLADEIDKKACQVIADNINAMQKYDIKWECDFPISANNYLLSKPQWKEVSGEEKRKALEYNRQAEDDRPVFSFPYCVFNEESSGKENKIYLHPLRSGSWVCEKGSTDYRVSVWFSENNFINLMNNDVVLYASRLYFVGYNQTGKNDKSFVVATLAKSPQSFSSMKHLSTVCFIRNASTKTF